MLYINAKPEASVNVSIQLAIKHSGRSALNQESTIPFDARVVITVEATALFFREHFLPEPKAVVQTPSTEAVISIGKTNTTLCWCCSSKLFASRLFAFSSNCQGPRRKKWGQGSLWCSNV